MGVLGLTLALAVAEPPRAQACGATPDSWVLRTNTGKTVYAGTTELDLYVHGSPEVSLHLFKLEAGQTEALEVAFEVDKTFEVWVLHLAEPVAAGADYVLKVERKVPEAATVTLAEQAFSGVVSPPRPTRIELELGQLRRGKITVGVCGDSLGGVEADIGLLDSPELIAWQRASRHQLLVDGAPAFERDIPQVSLVGMAQAPWVRAAADCGDPTEGPVVSAWAGALLQLEPNQYSVQWRLEFPDGSTLLSEVQQVDLRCDNDVPSEPKEPDEDEAVATPTPKASGGAGCSLTAGVEGRARPRNAAPFWASSWLMGLALGVRRLTRRSRS